MERFVRAVVAGGLAAVAGLWVAAVAGRSSPPWTTGVAVALAGALVLAAGTLAAVDP